MDIISHSVETGSTCWFQALAPNPLSADKRARRAPCAVARGGDGSGGQGGREDFWNAPVKTASASCGSCHDSDPFMYSPLVARRGRCPRDPLGLYANDIGEDFKAWPKPLSLSTRGNACTGCHRIGSQHTCNTAMYESIGEQPIPYADSWALVYPNSHWMPPGVSMNLAQWDLTYKQSVEALARCCKDPKAPGCITTPITGIKP